MSIPTEVATYLCSVKQAETGQVARAFPHYTLHQIRKALRQARLTGRVCVIRPGQKGRKGSQTLWGGVQPEAEPRPSKLRAKTPRVSSVWDLGTGYIGRGVAHDSRNRNLHPHPPA